MPGQTTREAGLGDLAHDIAKVFYQTQVSTANHQKNYVALYKLHVEAAQLTKPRDRGMAIKRIGELAFENVFFHMVTRVLPVKKSSCVADRVAIFIGGYTKFINEKAAEEEANRGDSIEDDEDDDCMASRYTAHLLRFLLQGFTSKDKSVRYRVLQIIAEMISNLGEIDETSYLSLRTALLYRIDDREPSVRLQAVIALSKLSGAEAPADATGDDLTVTDHFIDILSYDSAPEVRRAVLENIARNPSTLDAILSRTWDKDATIRKLIYSTILDPKAQQGDTVAAVHPRALTIAQRETVVRNGLGDREETVKAAAERLIGMWFEVISERDDDQQTPAGNEVYTVEDDLVMFLEMFDMSERQVAEDALLSIFTTKKGTFGKVTFGDAFWSSLNPEKALLARVYVEHCIATKDDARLESVLPVVTSVAFKIQSAYNDLLEDIQVEEEEQRLRDLAGDVEDRSEKEEQKVDKELVISEMLKLALNLDYADEIGRRKMFQLVRDMISQDVLPESLVAHCLDVLRALSANERDLIRVVVEVIHDLRDVNDDDMPKVQDAEPEHNGTPSAIDPVQTAKKPITERTPEEIARARAVDLRCLSLCAGMLERVNGKFEENSTLEGILGELILPAVKSTDVNLRKRGLVCLGLCCLIARRMALASLQLFLNEIRSSEDIIKTQVIQIVIDILMVHEGAFLSKRDEMTNNILKFLVNILEHDESPEVQALIATGLAKLVLPSMVTDEHVLMSLVIAYFSPTTAENLRLRQALSYFFQAYCYSTRVNQRRLLKIFIPSFEKLSQIRKEVEDEDEMVSAVQVVAQFIDWTDPQMDVRDIETDEVLHFDLASDMVRALFKKEMGKDDKKAFCQMLGKLSLPDKIDDYKLRCLKVLMHSLNSRRPLHDAVARNAFARFDAVVSKTYEKQLEGFNEAEYRKLEELKDLFEFLDDIIPEDEEIEINASKKGKSTRKRRSQSIISISTDVSASSRPGLNKHKVKKPRLSTSDDESDEPDDLIEVGHSPTPSLSVPTRPTRALPKRAVKKAIEVIVISDDDDEFVPERLSRKSGIKDRVKNEDPNDTPKLSDRNDRYRDSSSRGSLTPVNFNDVDDEDEMDEVNDLLAED